MKRDIPLTEYFRIQRPRVQTLAKLKVALDSLTSETHTKKKKEKKRNRACSRKDLMYIKLKQCHWLLL